MYLLHRPEPSTMRLLILLSVIAKAIYSLPCEGIWTSVGEKCCRLQAAKSSWNAHYINCYMVGGKLISIDSAETNAEITTFAGQDVFIGGAAYGPFGPAWVWADGRPFAFTNWKEESFSVPDIAKPCIRLDAAGFWYPECCGPEASLAAVCLRSF